MWDTSEQQIGFQLELMNNSSEAISAATPQLLVELKDTIDDLSSQTGKVAQYNSNISLNTQDALEGLESKQEALEGERRANNQAFRQRLSELATRKAQLDDRIRELLNLELSWVEELLPDGEVLRTTIGTPYIVINLGSNNGVFNGLRFQIFQYQRGRQVVKGMCEVIDTKQTIATCRVITENESQRNPIAGGDIVANPIFDQQRQLSFFLAGDFTKFNRSDLATFIHQTGGRVVDTLQPGVDYLVVGEGSQTRSEIARDTAREFRIEAIKETQLVDFVQTTFAAD